MTNGPDILSLYKKGQRQIASSSQRAPAPDPLSLGHDVLGARVAGTSMQITAGSRKRCMTQRRLQEMNGCAALKAVCCVRVSQPVRAYRRPHVLAASWTMHRTRDRSSGLPILERNTGASGLASASKLNNSC